MTATAEQRRSAGRVAAHDAAAPSPPATAAEHAAWRRPAGSPARPAGRPAVCAQPVEPGHRARGVTCAASAVQPSPRGLPAAPPVGAAGSMPRIRLSRACDGERPAGPARAAPSPAAATASADGQRRPPSTAAGGGHQNLIRHDRAEPQAADEPSGRGDAEQRVAGAALGERRRGRPGLVIEMKPTIAERQGHAARSPDSLPSADSALTWRRMALRSRMVWPTASSTSARLPPTSRWIAMAWATQAKSSLPMRSATSSRASVRSRPTRVSLTTRANSSDVGASASCGDRVHGAQQAVPGPQAAGHQLQRVVELVGEGRLPPARSATSPGAAAPSGTSDGQQQRRRSGAAEHDAERRRHRRRRRPTTSTKSGSARRHAGPLQGGGQPAARGPRLAQRLRPPRRRRRRRPPASAGRAGADRSGSSRLERHAGRPGRGSDDEREHQQRDARHARPSPTSSTATISPRPARRPARRAPKTRGESVMPRSSKRSMNRGRTPVGTGLPRNRPLSVDAGGVVEEEGVLQGDDLALHALHLGDVGDAAGAVAQPGDLDDEVDGGGDLLADGPQRQVHAGHQHQRLEPGDRVARASWRARWTASRRGRCSSPAACPALSPPRHLADDDAVGPHAQRVAHQVADGDLALALDVAAAGSPAGRRAPAAAAARRRPRW